MKAKNAAVGHVQAIQEMRSVPCIASSSDHTRPRAKPLAM